MGACSCRIVLRWRWCSDDGTRVSWGIASRASRRDAHSHLAQRQQQHKTCQATGRNAADGFFLKTVALKSDGSYVSFS